MKKSFCSLLILVLSLVLVGCGSGITLENETSSTVINDLPTASLSLIKVSTKEETITVEFSYSGENELTYGERYKIEVLQDNKWYSLKDSIEFYTDVGYTVENGQTRTESYDLSRFGTLPSGHYRIVIEVHDFIEAGNYTKHNLSVEFEIE